MRAASSEVFSTTGRILVVDDHPLVRLGLVELVADKPDLEVCGEAADAGEALELVRKLRPHLAVVDLSLKRGDGLELIKQISARYPQVKILVASMHDEMLYAERVIRAGALGYINKREDGAEFLEAIRCCLEGKIYLSPPMTERLLRRVANGADAIERPLEDRLSDRELQVFDLIGRGLSTVKIAELLFLSPKTIETYRENIKAKLKLENGRLLVRHAMQWVTDNC